MSKTQERVLVVENDPEISDLIARQVLKPFGYHVKVVSAATQAIQEAVQFVPDVVIANMDLPGLSGKDLLFALSSQGLEVPVIVMAEQGMEGDVIQAFRLGATDYLPWPLREAEIVSAVERALTQVRARHERSHLAARLEQANRELNRRVRDLTTIFSLGKAVTSITDQQTLFNRIVEGSIYVTEADKGWVHLKQGNQQKFVLRAYQNLPKSIAAKLGQPWDDGISSLVALSGEALSIHGDPLKRFKVARLGKTALVVPVKAQKEVVGLLVVVREKDIPFDAANQAMLEAVADYASVSLVNVQLFKAVEERAHSLQQAVDASQESEHMRADILRNVSRRLQPPLNEVDRQVDFLVEQDAVRNSQESSQAILKIRANLDKMKRVVAALAMLEQVGASDSLVTVNLVELAQQALQRSQDAAKQQSVTLVEALPPNPVPTLADVTRIAQVFDILLSNAIRSSSPKGQVTVQMMLTEKGEPHVSIQDTGSGIDADQRALIFHPFYVGGEDKQERLGVGLTLAKEIIKAHGGKIWADSLAEAGATLHFVLPPLKKATS